MERPGENLANNHENRRKEEDFPRVFFMGDLRKAYAQVAHLLSTHIAYRNGSEATRTLVPENETQTLEDYIAECQAKGASSEEIDQNEAVAESEREKFKHYWDALTDSLRP